MPEWTFRRMVEAVAELRAQDMERSEYYQIIRKPNVPTGPDKKYIEYMKKTYGHIINSPKDEIPQEVIDFLGEPPPNMEDFPEWLQEACNGVKWDVYNPGETKEHKEMIKKLSEKRLVRKLEHTELVTTERGFTQHLRQLMTGKECVFTGTFDHRTQMILDVISHRLLNESRQITATQAIRKNEEEPYTVEEIEEALEDFNMKVILTDKEIKEVLGLEDKISNREVYQAVMDLVEVELEGELKVYYNPVTGEFRSIILGGAERHFMGVIIDKTGRKSKRTGYEENLYCFTFTTLLSRTLLANIMNGNIMLKDRKFYKLKPGSQNIGNCLLPWEKGTRLSLEQLSKLAGLGNGKPSRRQAQVENYLSELKENGFVSGWKKYGRGKKTFYWVWKKHDF